jgi:hypothetical protein
MQKIIIDETGYLMDKAPPALYEELLQSLKLNEIETKIRVNNSYLAGNIEKEFDVTNLIPYNFYEYLASLANDYYLNFTLKDKFGKKTFKFLRSWLNCQKKYEFNPLHHHSGSLSWVLWIKIPYDVEEELKLSNSINSNDPKNSVFSFYSHSLASHDIRVNSDMEGSIIMFDSSLMHQVYPFYTSDEYRISLAGNITTTWLTKK